MFLTAEQSFLTQMLEYDETDVDWILGLNPDNEIPDCGTLLLGTLVLLILMSPTFKSSIICHIYLWHHSGGRYYTAFR